MATEYTKEFTVGAKLIWQPTVPTLGMTFNDFILEVALLGGMANYGTGADGIAAIPTDAHDLDLCKRIVNNALRMFIADGPPNGWRWMRRTARITFAPDGDGDYNVGGLANVYLLPIWFQGQVDGQITYDTNTNYAGPKIQWVDEATIRHMQSITSYSGYVKYAAVRPSSVGGTRRWELVVYPIPTRTDTIVFPWTIGFDKLVDTTDPSPAGFKFDDIVLSACLAKAEMELEEDTLKAPTGHVDMYKKTDLLKGRNLDGQSAPRQVGSYYDRGVGGDDHIHRNFLPVTFNGQ